MSEGRVSEGRVADQDELEGFPQTSQGFPQGAGQVVLLSVWTPRGGEESRGLGGGVVESV